MDKISSGTNRRLGSNFIWFEGVVEDVKDPKGLGRVKVRIFGDHTANKEDVKTEHLPWATVVMPAGSASNSGVGDAPVGMLPGTWVFGYYRDDTDKQQPRIMGTIPGVPQDEPDKDTGFNDPKGVFPSKPKKQADGSSLAIGSGIEKTEIQGETGNVAQGANMKGLSSISSAGKSILSGNKGASGEKDSSKFEGHPVHIISKKEVQKGMPSCAGKWDEPETERNPVYPYNKVHETMHSEEHNKAKWGHVEEWDSTPNKERYFRWHKSSHNSFEIFPDGKEVHKIYGDNFELDLAGKCLRVDGDYKITVQGNVDEHIVGDKWSYVEGNQVTIVGKDIIEVSHGTKTTHTDKGINVKSKSNITLVSEKDINGVAGKNINCTGGSNANVVGGSSASIGVGSAPKPNVGTVESTGEYTYTPYENTKLSSTEENKGSKEKKGKLYNKIQQWNQTISSSFSTFTKYSGGKITHIGNEHHCGANYMMSLDVASKITAAMVDAASTIQAASVRCMMLNTAGPASGCYSGVFLIPSGGGTGGSPRSPQSASSSLSSNAKQNMVSYKEHKSDVKPEKERKDPYEEQTNTTNSAQPKAASSVWSKAKGIFR